MPQAAYSGGIIMRAVLSFIAILALTPFGISKATTVLLDFDSVVLPPQGFTDATTYLAFFGISFVARSPGAFSGIASAAGSNSIFPSSPPNYFFISPPVTNQNVSGDLLFSTPLKQITFITSAVNPLTGVPAWDADAFNGETLLDSVSEPFLFPGPTARSFMLTGNGITRLHFDAFNGISPTTFNFPPIDNMTLTLAAVPEPGTLALLGLGLSTLAWRRGRTSIFG
jgi:hypothetical protein